MSISSTLGSNPRALISVTDTAGDGTLSYNNSTGVITYAGISDSQVRSKLSATSPISYNTGTGAISFSGDTDDVSEGTSNLYFTNTRARGAISVSGTGISYDSGTGVITLSEVGDIESVTAGDGLSGGGNSGALSLAVDSTVVRTSGTQSIAGAKTFSSSTTFSDSIVGPGSAVLFNANAKLQSSTISDLTTTNLSEGSNLYYTDARADARATLRINAATTDNISEGTGNLYYTDARVDARILNNIIDQDSFASDDATRAPSQQSTKAYIAAQIALKDNTDEITEGSSNLYFTDARARAVSIENVVEDATPELGGNLDLNNNNINGTGNIDFTGIVKLGAITSTSGTGGEIRWTGSDFVGYDGSAWNSLTAQAINQNTQQIANFTSAQNTTSTSFQDVPGYTTNITTTQTSSKLRVSLNITRSGDAGAIKLVRTIGATDVNNSSSDDYVTEVGTTDKNFCMVFKIENLKLFAGDYNVEITSKGISKFSHTSINLQYFIATESDSSFGG